MHFIASSILSSTTGCIVAAAVCWSAEYDVVWWRLSSSRSEVWCCAAWSGEQRLAAPWQPALTHHCRLQCCCWPATLHPAATDSGTSSPRPQRAGTCTVHSSNKGNKQASSQRCRATRARVPGGGPELLGGGSGWGCSCALEYSIQALAKYYYNTVMNNADILPFVFSPRMLITLQ